MIQKIKVLIGIDRVVFITLTGRAWGIFRSPITIFFIATYLTIDMQGYWYTFQSLGALTIFAELGFLTIISQFISHEYAHVKEEPTGAIVGKSDRTDRFLSLVKFSVKVYFYVIPIAFIFLTVGGFIFLNSSKNDLMIHLQWIAYSFAGATTLLVTLLGAILQGCNKVGPVQKTMFLSAIASSIAMWISLYLGLSIWSLAIGGLINTFVCIILFYRISPNLWKQALKYKPLQQYYWLSETLPLQGRYAVSWIAGFFIYSFITPITLRYAGAESAGKIGMSIALINALTNLAIVWGMTKVPQFNMLISNKEIDKLNILFNKVFFRGVIAYLLGGGFMILICIFIFPLLKWQGRILSIYEIIFLLFAGLSNVIIVYFSYYVRANKEEPFMWISIWNGLLTGVGVLSVMHFYGSTLYLVVVYTMIQYFIFAMGWRIFLKKRNELRILQINSRGYTC